MTTPLLGRPRARTLLVGAAAALATGLAAAPASAAVTLDWSTVNVFDSTAPRDTSRTWAGYVTNPANFSAKGTVSPIAPATGTTLTPASPRGLDSFASWTLPATAGSYNPAAFTGAIEFDGGVSFVSPSPAPRDGHGFTITIDDPLIQMTGGGTGLLYASGVHTPGAPGSEPVPYDRREPVFALRNGDWQVHLDGSSTITFTPEVAVSEYVFPRAYPAGAGPDRTPNTFGTFTIRIPANTGPKGDPGQNGTNGTNGTNGQNGTNGTNGRNGRDGRDGTTTVVRVQTTALATAPFSGRASRRVRVTARRSNRTLATGTVKGRKLTITLARGIRAKQLEGRYLLRLTGRSRGSAVVRLP